MTNISNIINNTLGDNTHFGVISKEWFGKCSIALFIIPGLYYHGKLNKTMTWVIQYYSIEYSI